MEEEGGHHRGGAESQRALDEVDRSSNCKFGEI